MIKRYIEARKRNGNSVQRLPKLKVYRNGATASEQYTFLMSNLEGFGTFIHIFVGNRHLWSVKVLVQIIQFLHQCIMFFYYRFVCFLQGFFFGMQRIVTAAQLGRMEKYSYNHLLFLHDFSVPFDDNISERDLRKAKNRQKMVGGFRKESGHEMYCSIMTIIETLKKRNMGMIENIKKLFMGTPAIF